MTNLLIVLYVLCSLWGAVKMMPNDWMSWRRSKNLSAIYEYLFCVIFYLPLLVWFTLSEDEDKPSPKPFQPGMP